MLISARKKLLGSKLCEEETQSMRQLSEEYCKGLFKSVSQAKLILLPWDRLHSLS